MHEYKQSPVLQVGGNQLKWFSISQETTGSIMISMLYAFVFSEGIRRLRLKLNDRKSCMSQEDVVDDVGLLRRCQAL